MVSPSPVKLFVLCTWSSGNIQNMNSQEQGHSEMQLQHPFQDVLYYVEMMSISIGVVGMTNPPLRAH